MGLRLVSALVAAALAWASTGCSWVFMERVPKRHPVDTEPRCTASKGWAAADSIETLSWIFVVLMLKRAEEIDPRNNDSQTGGASYAPAMVGAGFMSGLHFVSALSGFTWAARCQSVRRSHDRFLARGGGRGESTVSTLDAERLQREMERRAAPPPPPAVAHPYFCTASPVDSTVGECVRTAEECAETQQRLVAGGHDVGPCLAAAAAVCFDATRADGSVLRGCAPTVGACIQQREPATLDVAYVDVTPCADR